MQKIIKNKRAGLQVLHECRSFDITKNGSTLKGGGGWMGFYGKRKWAKMTMRKTETMRLNCGKTEMNSYAETENSVFLSRKTEMNNVNVENGKNNFSE